MLTIKHLEVIKKNFKKDDDSEKVLNSDCFKGWTLPVSQISYISDVISALDGDLKAVKDKFELDSYFQELNPFKPGFKKTLPKKKPDKKNKNTKRTFDDSKKSSHTKKNKKIETKDIEKKTKKEVVIMNTDLSSYLERITDYQIVSAHTTFELNKEVNKEMELYGWIPYGGASVAHAGMGSSLGGSGSYFQAMVKLKEK
jgi:hypothetical protein